MVGLFVGGTIIRESMEGCDVMSDGVSLIFCLSEGPSDKFLGGVVREGMRGSSEIPLRPYRIYSIDLSSSMESGNKLPRLGQGIAFRKVFEF